MMTMCEMTVWILCKKLLCFLGFHHYPPQVLVRGMPELNRCAHCHSFNPDAR